MDKIELIVERDWLRERLAASEGRAKQAEAERDQVVERSMDVIMNYCGKHQREVSFGEFMELTANCGCRVCLAEAALAASEGRAKRLEEAAGRAAEHARSYAAYLREYHWRAMAEEFDTRAAELTAALAEPAADAGGGATRRTPPPATAELLDWWRHELEAHGLLRTGASSIPVDAGKIRRVLAEWAQGETPGGGPGGGG